ncbi:Amidohydrolase family protein [Nostocoides japonicum T1-X7]|uniref:Amidohydrolase family protein n=1 Tax=Nostocoides japonicum T1-X7 TaxID=1194083 RepID=A0A077M2W6_9MICO|nr:amidohydrolase [Tetrasphaera japonica]CCH79437.1 Amidohydrolase family protein [Tetrasphaera japonica T1-X7]
MSTRHRTTYANATVFTAGARPWAQALVVDDDAIAYVGDLETARRVAGPHTDEVDLGGRLVLPGFVDGHAHVVSTGEVQGYADLTGAPDLAGIQARIRTWAAEHPDVPRVRAHSWVHAAVGGRPDRQMLDAVVADRPVYAEAYDFHSIWVNSAALAELGIDASTPDPPGGRIERDPTTGEPTGFIDETAMQQLVWPYLNDRATDADRDAHLRVALDGYRRAGITAAVDMGLTAEDLAAMSRAEEAGTLTAHLVGHWVLDGAVPLEASLAAVAEAARQARRHASPSLRVAGIKILVDGTVDGCTAALKRPYADGSLPDAIWDPANLSAVVTAADAAGLQVAMHAIGDEAVRIAVDAVEAAVRDNGPRRRRHRIEHLEVVDAADIARLAALGITASMQPVHADPAIQENWRAMLGDDRVDRGFPWPELTGAGAALAFGTDSPTAPYPPLRNLFIAATRRSAFDPSLPPNLERYALPLTEAVTHATRDAAWACGAEEQFGQLAAGLAADFVVLDRDVFSAPPEELLEAAVVRTVVGGRTVWSA